MRKLADIDILSDKPLQLRVNALAIAVMAVGVVGFVAAGIAWGLEGFGEDGLWWSLGLLAGYFLPLPVHELVHAAFFKLFSPGARITFGFQSGFLYAGAPGTVYTRAQGVVILLSPAVIVTSALAVIVVALGYPATAWLLAWSHLGGCSGDLLMAWRMLTTSGCTHFEDTPVGVTLLQDEG